MPGHSNAFAALTLLMVISVNVAQAQILEAVELIDDAPGLFSVTSIEISPDGRHLYAVSPAAQLVSAYARDAETGSLSLLDSEPYDTAGITSSLFGNSLFGSSLFGSQASLIQGAQFLLVGSLFETGRDLAIFHRNAASGELELLDDSILTLDAEQIMVRYAVSPDGDSLYVILRTPQQFPDSIFNLLTYSISSSGTTALVDTRVIPDVGPALITGSLQVSPDGRHLYVAGEPGFIGPGEPGQLFSRNLSTGLLSFLDDLEQLSLIGQPATTFSSDGTRLYYRDVLGDSPPIPVLGSLRRDQTSGEMSAEAMALTSANSAGFDDDLALAENGRLLAIADRLGLFITPVIGGEFIDLQDQISNSLVDFTLTTAVTFSPDEKFLYAALNGGINADDGMLVFRNRGLLEPPAVPALSSLASLCLFALLLLAAAVNLRKRTAH